MKDVKFRPAPSGKLYAIWRGHPLVGVDGGLCYFDTKRQGQNIIRKHDPVLDASGAVTMRDPTHSRKLGLRSMVA